MIDLTKVGNGLVASKNVFARTTIGILLALFIYSTVQAADLSPDLDQSVLREGISADSVSSVIVKVTLPEAAFEARTQSELRRYQRVFDELFKRLEYSKTSRLRAISKSGNRSATTMSFINSSMRSLRATARELAFLKTMPGVTIYPNRWHKVNLEQSVPLIFPDQANTEFDGSGRTVVLLDTGVDASHSFLTGAVLGNAAACFSNDNNGAGSIPGGESLCPDGPDAGNFPDGQFFGAGAADACDVSIDNCQHGTQMAGIIAGASDPFNGVATGSQIIPIQVFTKSNDVNVCGDQSVTPCVGALTSDIVRALEYVGTIARANNIAAVSVSFGSATLFQGACDNQPEKPSIDTLLSQGIAVIASSGNDGSAVAMTSPACISSAISIASSNVQDQPSSFNNRNSELDFFAPGEAINTSTLPANSFSQANGTSAATAHVAGAWAVLKNKRPNASVAQIKRAFESSGVLLTQGLITKPRINVSAGLAALPEPSDDNSMCFPVVSRNQNVAIICL